jgi:hypothetical protein
MIITAVERERRSRRVSVFVDGELALTMGRGLAAEHNLRPGRPTNPAELAALAGAEARRGALEAAQRLLTYRPRSERELRQRLRRKGFDAPVVAETLAKLREHGYVDDEGNTGRSRATGSARAAAAWSRSSCAARASLPRPPRRRRPRSTTRTPPIAPRNGGCVPCAAWSMRSSASGSAAF